MSSHRPNDATPPGLAASETWLLWQCSVMVALTALGKAGRAGWAPLAELLVGLLGLVPLLLALQEARRERARGEESRVSWRAFTPFALYALMVLISLLNLSHERTADGGWQEVEAWEAWLPASLDFQLTLDGCQAWALALFEAGLIGAVLKTRKASRNLCYALLGIGLSLAVIGTFYWFSGSPLMLGFLPVDGGQFFATFVYKNHWAAYALMLSCLAAGLAFSAWDKSEDDRRAGAQRLFAFSSMCLLLLTIPLPISRSGMVLAALVALIVFLNALLRIASNRGKSKSWRLGMLSVVLVLCSVVVVRVVALSLPSIQTGWERSEREYTTLRDAGRWNLRVYSARDTLAMASARPWFGWGAGTFGAVFPLYQGDYLRDSHGVLQARYLDAHCDWAQVPAENGFVGLLILAGSALLAWWHAWKKGSSWRRWTLGGLALIAFYAVAEFPFQNPAVLLLWCSLLALCASAPGKTRTH